VKEDKLKTDLQVLLKEAEKHSWQPEHWSDYRQRIENLLNSGIQSYDHLYQILRDRPQDETLRKNAFDLTFYLTKYVDKRRVVPPLLAELLDKDSPHRWFVAQTLGLLESKRAEAPLIQIVLDRQEPEEIRHWSVIALSYSKTAADVFFPLLTDKTESPRIRGELIDKMYYWWGERAIPPLIECLSDESEEVRFWACFGLYCFFPYAADTLLELDRVAATDTGYGMWHVRREALGAMERIYYPLRLRYKPEDDEYYYTPITYLISPLVEYFDFNRASWQQKSDIWTMSPLEQSTNLRIDPNWLAEKLQEQWPEVRLNMREPKLQSLLLDWELGAEDKLLIGGLQNDAYAVSLTCRDDTLVAEFAAWYRSIIAPEYKLFLYEWADRGRELSVGMTVKDVVKALER
jgi:hypothetical protein